MSLDRSAAFDRLRNYDFSGLFTQELGWNWHKQTLPVTLKSGTTFTLTAVAHQKGMVAYHLALAANTPMPDYATRRQIEQKVSQATRENIVIYTDAGQTTQIWQWVKRSPGQPTAAREHCFHKNQSGEGLLQKLGALFISLAEEENLTLVDVTSRVQRGFDVERITKEFYRDFDEHRKNFLGFIDGFPPPTKVDGKKKFDPDHEWYASVMLNRLMFVYFIQRKGFLAGDSDYLRSRLKRCQQEQGKDKFYSFYRYFLLRLFHEGFGKRRKDRAPDLEKLLGNIPYLNGGLFDVHELEKPERYGKDIQIPDKAFERIFDYFDKYQWHLDERPLREGNEINPDVLGYIFEKYINQKQMGAYYTKEDITEYISKNTILPFLFDAARAKCQVAFVNPVGPTVWDLLRENPDRYIYSAVRHGAENKLPSEIAVGLDTTKPNLIERRKAWNKPAPSEYALLTETWREVVARRQRYEDIRTKLVAGEVREVNDFITLNLDLRQFAQDVIENCEGPDLLMAFWQAITKITVLDPTGGSGAFIFAALNILEPLYEACLERMEAFLAEWGENGRKVHPNYYKKFTEVLTRVDAHPNRRYFVLKSIILNNLYAVDIMEEAVEICKLRLFLKLASQVEPDTAKDNLGIEPLPDIDFNVRAGNTLVGYATYDEVKRAVTSTLDFDNAMEKISTKAADLQQTFDKFRQLQTEGEGSVPAADKLELKKRLGALEDELNRHLAGEYGVKVSDKTAFNKWVKSYQPFHWFIQFHGILNGGGFDVIIGNPPYLEYSKVKDYKIRNYNTEECANLYVFTVERSYSLIGIHGRIGMIIPISIACSGAMATLRDEVARATRSLWLSHFSNRPGQLFTGAQNRLTILVTSDKRTKPQQFSTRYHRWNARSGERENLFPVLQYQELAENSSMFHGLLPKMGCREAVAALEKIRSNKTVEFFKSRTGRYKVYWVRVPGYFCQFLLEPPMARPEGGGAARVRGEVNDIAFDEKISRHVVHAILNSSIYYQFFCIYTDTRHINPSDVSEFPLDLTTFSNETKALLVDLSLELSKSCAAHTSQWRKSGLLIDSIDSKPTKPILDEIDTVLAKHYGFTPEELDFVLTYDIKYRLGHDTDSNEE